ncbi:hypothetical protein chiPu_0017328 [Chiloscyllium punctatum]|uniref:Uncharacterized protein n=1 Tax=Chiloscyllium punctatum TaxID=137246 RepID=A0A401RF10_CHIPU|nr:hypothetical protein [Chiloscyllium punctatum]
MLIALARRRLDLNLRLLKAALLLSAYLHVCANFYSSEVLASSIDHLLNTKLAKLQHTWDVVGIPEDKRVELMASAVYRGAS